MQPSKPTVIAFLSQWWWGPGVVHVHHASCLGRYDLLKKTPGRTRTTRRLACWPAWSEPRLEFAPWVHDGSPSAGHTWSSWSLNGDTRCSFFSTFLSVPPRVNFSGPNLHWRAMTMRRAGGWNSTRRLCLSGHWIIDRDTTKDFGDTYCNDLWKLMKNSKIL